MSSSSTSTTTSSLSPRTFTKSKLHRSKLSLDIVMSCFNNITSLRDSFKQYHNGVSVYEFIKILRNNIKWNVNNNNYNNEKEEVIIQSLIELFNSMNLNNNLLKFDDFLSTIINTGTDGTEFNIINPISNYIAGPELHVNTRVDKLLSYLTIPDRLLVIEKNTFRLLDPISFIETSGKPYICKSGNIIASEYIPAQQYTNCNFDMLAFTTTQCISLWEKVSPYGSNITGDNKENLNKNRNVSNKSLVYKMDLYPKSPQTALKWSPSKNILYSGGMDGLVNYWDLINETHGTLGTLDKTAHTDVVTAIENIERLDMIASASLDSTIRLWDIGHQTERKCLTGHKKGVVSLSYSDDCRFLLSGSFDHSLCLWSPFADKLVFRMNGHVSPICNAQFLPNTPQIVSVDQDGWVKVWDIRNFQCVSTFHSTSQVCSFTATAPNHERLFIASSRSILTFEQEFSNNIDSAIKKQHSDNGDDETAAVAVSAASNDISALVYNPVQLSFATANGRDIKIWNSLTGILQRVHRDVIEDEITALCLDDEFQKIIVGDRKGNIIQLNYSTCGLLRKLHGHTGEVCYLSYIGEDRTVISCGFDGLVYIHDDKLRDDEKNPKYVLNVRLNKYLISEASSRPNSSVKNNDTMKRSISNSLLNLNKSISRLNLNPVSGLLNNGNDDSIPEVGKLVKSDVNPCVCATSSLLSLIAMNSTDPKLSVHNCSSQIHIFDLETGRVEGSCLLKRMDEANKDFVHTTISCLAFLDPFPFIAAGDEEGYVSVFFLRPSPYRGQLALSFQNNSAYESICGVTNLTFDKNTQTLFTGDNRGFIRAWDLSGCFERIGEVPIDQLISLKISASSNGSKSLIENKRRQPILEEIQRNRTNAILLKVTAHDTSLSDDEDSITPGPKKSNKDAVKFNSYIVPIPSLIYTKRCYKSGTSIKYLQLTQNPDSLISIAAETALLWDNKNGNILGSITWNRDAEFTIIPPQCQYTHNTIIDINTCEWKFTIDLAERQNSDAKYAADVLYQLDHEVVPTTTIQQRKVVKHDKFVLKKSTQKEDDETFHAPMTYVSAKDKEIDSMLRDHPLISPGAGTTTIASPFFGENENRKATLKSSTKPNLATSVNIPKQAKFKTPTQDSILENDDSLANLIESAMKAADSKIAESEVENITPPQSVKPTSLSFKDELDAFKSKIQTLPQKLTDCSSLKSLNHSLSSKAISHSSEPRSLNHSTSTASLKSSQSRKTLQKSASMSLFDNRSIEKAIIPVGGLNKKIISKMNDSQATIALKLNALLDSINKN